MVRRKYEVMGHIKDDTKRKVILCKRRQGLIKKAMELSKLCAVDVCLFVLDRDTSKYSQYSSQDQFTPSACQQIIDNEKEFKGKRYTNSDYDEMYQHIGCNKNNGLTFKDKFEDHQVDESPISSQKISNNGSSDPQHQLTKANTFKEIFDIEKAPKSEAVKQPKGKKNTYIKKR